MKKIGEKGFAITAILYTMLILAVLLMFLIIGILSNRRATLNKMSSTVRKEIDGRKNLLYDVLKNGNGGAANLSNLTAGIYSSKEGGTDVYYYRGAVNNNYVIFADMCWQMMRTTPSKGVKIVYSGTPVNDTCPNVTAALTSVRYGPNAYNNTEMNERIQEWYRLTAKLTAYESQLELTNFCNDNSNSSWSNVNNSSVDFTCPTTGTNYSSYIGIPTVIEVAFAGGSKTGSSRDYYLKTTNMVTMSRTPTPNTVAYIDGNGLIQEASQEKSFSVRPVITLKEGTTYDSGSGTAANPYIITK